jgi:hypothetical protein
MDKVVYIVDDTGISHRYEYETERVYYSQEHDSLVIFTPIPDLKQYLVQKDNSGEAALTKLHPFVFGLEYLGDL